MYLITYIIATHNEQNRILSLLESIPRSFYDFSIFHIQDCLSTDHTLTVVETFISYNPAVKIHVTSQSDSGIYDAWNMAVAKCVTKWVSFLGADDIFIPNEFNLKALLLHEHSNYITFEGSFLGRPYGKPLPRKLQPISFIHGWSIQHQGSIYKLDLLRLHNFNTSFKICADFEHMLRVRSKLVPRHINARLYDIGPSGLSSSSYLIVAVESAKAFLKVQDIGPLRFFYAAYIFAFILLYWIYRLILQLTRLRRPFRNQITTNIII